jgi:Coenzyme PQQ synthesis protein D (PqqD)
LEPTNPCPRPAPEVVYRDLAQGGVLLHLGSGQYHGVNAIGALIWDLIDGTRTTRQITALLADQIEEPPPELEADVAAFVGGLRDRGLVAA